MGQKVVIMFWWEFGLCLRPKTTSLLFAKSPSIFCKPSIACLRLCSAIVHFIRNNRILSAKADQRKR